MNAQFSCYPKKIEKNCMFRNAGGCGDHVSPDICNRHASIFGIEYGTISCLNGNNDSWSKIVMYVVSTTNLYLPLFIDKFGTILSDQVRDFMREASRNLNENEAMKIHDILACLLGVHMYDTDNGCNTSWLNEKDSHVIRFASNNDISYTQNIPQFYKNIFKYAQPSLLSNSSTGTQVYSVPNVALTYDETNDSYAFAMTNKSSLLKKTNEPDCLATPIVLDAVRIINKQQRNRVIKPLNNINYMC